YYGSSDATAAVFTNDGWLRTGDIGVIYGKELYICGRSKEVVILNGQNYYPQDIEAIASRAPGVDVGKVAAVGIQDPDSGAEQLVVFVVHRGGISEFLPIAARVGFLINQHANLEVRIVVPLKRMPKTTSGKLQRLLLKEKFLDGDFDTDLQALAVLRA